MTSFDLKDYQTRSLEALRSFLDRARVFGPKEGFQQTRGAAIPAGFRAPYKEIAGLEDVPYVCLRIPTGGGKTLLAAYSIPLAGETYLDQEFPATMWFVPSRAIQQQTAEAMKEERHPYRLALDDAFGGRVRVFDLSEISQIRPSDLTESACVIVGTLAAMRIGDTDSRHFYAHNENFEAFFRTIRTTKLGLERDERGRIKYSFANLMYLKRPIAIIDEAHNARTGLTFESLKRVNPAVIVEFTATPDRDPRVGSNVLYSVSAKELRDAEMIKMPIVLTEHRTWQDAVHGAVVEREKLAAASSRGGDVVRPIVLLQAQSKDRDVNVERLVDHLRDNEGIERDRIAIATGDQRELEGLDLFDSTCKIDYIVTVAALREGWDCSYAYVLCSVGDLRSATAVEQLLGRVLRMPFAKRRSEPSLNKAYAHVVSQSFIEAAESLQDRLVDRMGFDSEDFLDAIEPGYLDLFGARRFDVDERSRDFVVELPGRPTFPFDSEDIKVSYAPSVAGAYLVRVSGKLTREIKDAILAVTPRDRRERMESQFRLHELMFERPKSPAERGEQLTLPLLSVVIDGERELADPQCFLDCAQWNLLAYPPEIPNFNYDTESQTWIYDFFVGPEGKETLAYRLADNQGEDMLLPGVHVGWTETDLLRWLDRRVRDESTPQTVMLEWLRRLLKHLVVERCFSLETLVKAKFILAAAVSRYIGLCKKRAIAEGYQTTLFGPQAAPKADFRFEFSFPPDAYAPSYYYTGSHQFTKHFYPRVGELKSEGEELHCAKVIDGLRDVEYWVRNLGRGSGAAFWLPTSSDRFYPDFVCKLTDGRFLVIEYKGEMLKTNDDSAEKKQIGELWARSSGGRCLFLMAVKDDAGRDVRRQITDLVSREF